MQPVCRVTIVSFRISSLGVATVAPPDGATVAAPRQVGRLLQPAVIWIDSAEKTFVKKVPKTDKTEPKRLKKELPKLLKALTPADRLLLVGTSETPWEADQKVINARRSCVVGHWPVGLNVTATICVQGSFLAVDIAKIHQMDHNMAEILCCLA